MADGTAAEPVNPLIFAACSPAKTILPRGSCAMTPTLTPSRMMS